MSNGVDTKRFAPAPFDHALAATLGVAGHPIIGFIGSFFYYEGLDCLVRAMPAILEPGGDRQAGRGNRRGRWRDTRYGTGSWLTSAVLLDRKSSARQILSYYSLLDVMVYPRRSERVTELVTPLKPLEAMAVGKAVVGSDVGGMQEISRRGTCGQAIQSG